MPQTGLLHRQAIPQAEIIAVMRNTPGARLWRTP